ncbi:MAG: hypothetical protein HFJ34_00050 [Clostridia bacterium]|nr:hypothetical protein [Clostridia bacterium]
MEEAIKQKIIYETNNFIIGVPIKPHIPREDGGHIWIRPKKFFCDRTKFDVRDAIEMMRLSMIAGEAMQRGMEQRGIHIERINYQENGNWSYLEGVKPSFHLHLYGRTKNAKSQKWGEALYFPNPTSEFYHDFEPFNDEDIQVIKNEILILEKTQKYDICKWRM